MAFVVLILALALFLFSTRQMALRWRIAVWVAATALLGTAAVLNMLDQRGGLLVTSLRDPDAVADAFKGNWPTVADYVGPTLDVLVLLAALIGIGCLVAFMPGERTERVIRPINIALVGAVFGAVIALAVSAVGFGPVSKRQVFLGKLLAEDVVDGDTFRMGAVSLRLWGIDAPEDHQICLREDRTPYDCGALATEAFEKLVTPGNIHCRHPGRSEEGEQLRESFGRPLVQCGGDHQGKGNLPNIGRELVKRGYAYPYESPDGKPDSDYGEELAEAQGDRRGLHRATGLLSGGFLPPTKWRNKPGERCVFLKQAGPIIETNAKERKRLTNQLADLLEGCPKP